jgi:ribonuclease E
MVNTEGRGGISKKVVNIRDRKVLKNILNTLNPDSNRSIIIRTAGVGRKPEEISRDYVYLVRLWNAIKKVTMESIAPVFIHSEDDLLKRTVRDLYSDKISEIVVEGRGAFESIKSLTRTVMPEQRAVVHNYTDKVPLFYRYRIEDQIEQLYNNKIELPSGGSIVIDQTEALVAIDVNSGKSTREKSVEEMALTTNIEAAREIARQLRLRNIGGLVVIDFIDMYEGRNRRTVERVMREETVMDKAKTQIDRISIFGLMEMSRQRIHAGLYETVNEKCPNCSGRGTIRSKYMVISNILRSVKIAARERYVKVVYVLANNSLVNFMLNYRRSEVADIEKNYGITIIISGNDNMDNRFEIKKRSSLSDVERKNLYPTQQVGKVNRTFEEDEFYEENNDGIEPNFADNCYYSKYDGDSSRDNDRSEGKQERNYEKTNSTRGTTTNVKNGTSRKKNFNKNGHHQQPQQSESILVNDGRPQKSAKMQEWISKIKNLFWQ